MEKVNLHIPLKIALYDAKGTKQMLQHNGELLSDVLNVTEKDQVFEFHGIYGRPTPALYVISLHRLNWIMITPQSNY